jgi:hypothetical protein
MGFFVTTLLWFGLTQRLNSTVERTAYWPNQHFLSRPVQARLVLKGMSLRQTEWLLGKPDFYFGGARPDDLLQARYTKFGLTVNYSVTEDGSRARVVNLTPDFVY